MTVVDLAWQPEPAREEAARLLVDGFDKEYAWPDYASARGEVGHILRDGFARAMIDSDHVIGWVGGLPEYSGRVWELHPLVVPQSVRGRGIGRELVSVFESEAARRGALTATLGTDDKTGMTTLAGVDLYRDVPGCLASARDLGRNHPFGFYLKMGFVITGLVPDANGPGRPDILMSKRL